MLVTENNQLKLDLATKGHLTLKEIEQLEESKVIPHVIFIFL